jgi:RNA polymerase sigma-70 factor (ECF subfamily)
MTREASDDDLLGGLRAGDEGAFRALYARWQGRLFRFALRLTGRPEVAEDVTQEVFLALIHASNGFDPTRGALAPYLYGSARNQVRRRLERDRAYLFTDDDPADLPAPEDPLAELACREDAEAVRQAVLSLPPHYREAVVLCDLEQLPYEAAAAVLGCALGTVRSRLHRARLMLAAKLRTRRPIPEKPA